MALQLITVTYEGKSLAYLHVIKVNTVPNKWLPKRIFPKFVLRGNGFFVKVKLFWVRYKTVFQRGAANNNQIEYKGNR